ncbi:MAG TPA: hypothetical protein VF142_18295 [Longimicrobium sp.]
MSFTLHVDFVGLCLHVRHEDDPNRVAVLMPDARSSRNPQGVHVDRSPAVPHVGYVRLDAANLPERLPHAATPGDDPRYELIHRLEGEELVFDESLAPQPVDTRELTVPEFNQFAPGLELLPGLFGAAPPSELLMRTIVMGGVMSSDLTAERWEIPSNLNPAQPLTIGKFASAVAWKREVEGSSITLTIRRFDGTEPRQFVLAPVAGETELRVKVANLCAHNPLEWDDMPLRTVRGDDKDFKWLYHLHRPRNGESYDQLLQRVGRLPIPTWLEAHNGDTASNDCIAGGTTSRF